MFFFCVSWRHQELNVHFRTIIVPESLKNIECQEPSVVTSIEALDALIDSCDQPLDSLISGLEKQLMNAIMGLEVSARAREYRSAA